MGQPPNVPVSVCLIAKNCAKGLATTIRSLREFLQPGDEVLVLDTGSTDRTPRLAAKLGCTVIDARDLCDDTMLDRARRWCPDKADVLTDHQFDGGFLRSFAEARQRSFDAARHDVCMWIDTDDELLGGKKLREGINAFFGSPEPKSAIFIKYLYAHDEIDGACTTELWRERVVDRRRWKWAGRCHETLIPVDGLPAVVNGFVRPDNPEIAIRHGQGKRKTPGVSDLRNYTILRREAEETAPAVDPRTVMYLGNAARGLLRLDEAVDYYAAFLGTSGSWEDRLSAALNAAACRAMQRRYWGALEWATRAEAVAPTDPRPQFTKARVYYHLGLYEACIRTTHYGRSLPLPQTLHNVDPQQLDFYPTYFLSEALRELGRHDEAVEEVRRLAHLRPGMPQTHDQLRVVTEIARTRKLAEAVVATARLAPDEKTGIALTQMIRNPEILEDLGIGRLEEEVPQNGGPTLAIFCGKTGEPWGPASLLTGIGGSERMVLELAPRWQALGMSVTVYADVPREQRGRDDRGVTWRHNTEFNTALKRDVLLVWRAPETLRLPVAAKKRYVWLHDCVGEDRFKPDLLELSDKIIPLSAWHRGLYKGIPDSKIWVSRNGVDSALFRRVLAEGKRNPKRVLYCSSPDRGVLQALAAFSTAREQDPDLTLDICYGFTPYWHKAVQNRPYSYVPTQKCVRHLHEFAEDVRELAQRTPGVTWLGRIPCRELALHMASSGVWLYPALFTEISCMSAMEAQAAGMAVVASDVAALAETINWSSPAVFKVDPEDTDDTARRILEATAVSDKDRAELSEAALRRFDLDDLARQWHKALFV